MDNLIIEKTKNSPGVHCDAENGIIEFTWRSNLENAESFYKPIFEWVDKYIENPAPQTEINFKMSYFNTSSSKLVMQILEKLAIMHKKTNSVTLNWYYEDEDMYDYGDDFKEILELPTNFIELE